MSQHEILSADQPCIVCGYVMEVVTWHRDPETGRDWTERVALDPHDCSTWLRRLAECWPTSAEVITERAVSSALARVAASPRQTRSGTSRQER